MRRCDISGGSFDYKQHSIQDIRDDIEHILKHKREYDKEWDCITNDYSDETFAEFEKALPILQKAYIFAQRIDWLVSGDDGEESFHERLKEELKELE